MIHCIKLNIGTTTSVSLVLSICVLFISLMHSVNRAHFLNTYSLSLSFGIAGGGGGGTGAIDIVPLTSTYGSL